jgi:hypothetical protein
MGAVVERAPFGEVALSAIRAGHDQILVCHRPERIFAAWNAIREGLRSGDLDATAAEASLSRIAAFKSSPACRHAEEPHDPGELRLVLDEMDALIRRVERAVRLRRPGD